ncbi:hypothetical protein IWW50_005835, partial [Coemansia erecta]
DSDLPKETKHLEQRHRAATHELDSLTKGLSGYVATNLSMVELQTQASDPSADSKVKTRFKELYMEYVTEGFGADLDVLRKGETIDDEGLEMLVYALETGVQSFTDADQKMIVG